MNPDAQRTGIGRNKPKEGLRKATKLGWRGGATIAVELYIKNTVLGLFVATQSFGSLEAGVPIAAVMTFQMPFGIGVLVLYNVWRRRQPTAEAIS